MSSVEEGRRCGEYEVHRAREGFSSIRHWKSGEILHARTEPMIEARTLYTGAGGLRELLSGGGSGPVVVWDVGLGAAANAMAAILEHEALRAEGASLRELHLVSFEVDLDPLRLAFQHEEEFPTLRHPAVASLLETGHWISQEAPRIVWELREGSFPETLEDFGNLLHPSEPPDLIFYDLFSGKTHPEAWWLKTFERLFRACGGHATTLCTYTCSTAARTALLAAGFHVAQGPPAGDKAETTIACTPAACSRIPFPFLGSAWRDRRSRSSAKYPTDVSPERRGMIDARIAEHPQFAPGKDVSN